MMHPAAQTSNSERQGDDKWHVHLPHEFTHCLSSPGMLNSGTFKTKMILITNSKVTLSMALWANILEAWDASLSAPNM